MKTFIILLMIVMNQLYGSDQALPLKIHIVQECFLGNVSPLRKSNEQNIYQLEVENEKTYLGGEAVKEIALIADGKRFLIKNNEAHPEGYSDGKRKYPGNYKIYGEDLEILLEAQEVYAVILYKKIVTEENEHNPLSIYDSKVQTTVIKRSYFPVIIDRENAQNEFVACTTALKVQKERKIKLETSILLGIGTVAAIVLFILWRRKQRNNIS